MQIQEDKPYDDINITPMLDLAYVLLVIFILMCTASIQGAKVNLPTESKSKSKVEKKSHAISIGNDGKMTFDGIPIASLQDLEQKLNAIRSTTPDFPVVVKGSSKTAYQNIADVIDVVQIRCGITQLGVATLPQTK
jgi:biopolymer transport protein ExbD